MSKFLVTGGAGFIGSHLVEALVQKKHFIRVLDNFSSGKKKNIEGVMAKIELVRGDIRSKDTCLKAAKGMDFILHQAALRSVPKSMNNPKEYNEVNINGTLNILEAALKNKVKSFVFASSSSVYGDVKDFPQKEGFSPAPISPYALTKLAGEHYCRIFSRYYGLPTVSLRYFNVFGPRQGLDDEYAVVIPKFIHCILNGKPAPVYGTGRQSRDFTYVANVVEANILASQKQKFRGEVFNVAFGRDYTVLELLKSLNKIMRKDIKPVFLTPRPGDVFKTKADITKIQKLLSYRPRIDFLRGLELTAEYFRNA
ncbi:MAG: NAD-dependent epimerase/dehydratase family protein [Candidatus Omnitrophica bacterium]|nr:NAD-dependent epimerase/dehydratase family protein [Candidatus Omnitrophota bacterium]MDD5591998.1 NAD-dependent epimerase/dehydratase family protein [Candidatus Omnitrophota bacterium]